MANEEISLSWSAPYLVTPSSPTTRSLPGDKILLPPSALGQLLAASTVTTTSNNFHAAFDPFNPYSLAAARQQASQWQDTQQQLPHPLTFRLLNPKNGSAIHAGIREFSADEGKVGLSPFLMNSLGLHDDETQRKANETDVIATSIDPTAKTVDDAYQIIVQAKQLPKGTYVRLRPLEAGYNPDDWKSLLERHLRENFTTLTNGEILTIPGDRRTSSDEFRFLIDKFEPEGDGICVVDTDLEVDIEALNEEQARETLKQIIAKSQKTPGTSGGSSVGGTLDIWNAVEGQVLPGEYVDYELPSWDKSQGVEFELTMRYDDNIDLFVSPLSARQRARPREDEHVFANFESETSSKRIILPASNVEAEGAEALHVSVHACKVHQDLEASVNSVPRHYMLRARAVDSSPTISTTDDQAGAHNSDDEQCKNCHQWVPKRTMMLHENFCLRNNILCPHCQGVFKKSSAEWKTHWHCPHDSAYGNHLMSKAKHDGIFHTSYSCPGCSYNTSSLPSLASHRTTVCPAKLILCQFCHLSVPQDGDPFSPSADQLLSGLTAHELADGSRTTNCHLCDRIIRLRDMATHLKHHELSRQSKPLPRICRNVNCGRTLDGVGKNGEIGAGARIGQGPGNELGLCSICFGPLYVSMHDPEGKAMKRRIERRYIGQLISGCGKSWCTNIYCKIGRVNTGVVTMSTTISTKEALPMVKPLMEGVLDNREPMYLCVDEGSQKRRGLAEMIAGEGVYQLEWCVAACEAGNGDLDRVRSWLRDWAPKRNET
ncbi:MAG: hypothetical protein M1818_002243 [Claussenomyces sp. TS43310]|nr:MAG: hypothetical protein M1818_002243 [Claussenomyces sp. TS43310]